eukprot:scaffold19641_cov112-Phaeocystis_antarctica.AAC.1
MWSRDQDAGVGPIGSFATFEMPSDRRFRTEQAPEIHDSPAETLIPTASATQAAGTPSAQLHPRSTSF